MTHDGRRHEPPFFTPDDEPYRELKGVVAFDAMIIEAFRLAHAIAGFSSSHSLSRLQRAAAQIVPQGLNLALGMRELIRQGHLFSSAVLVRSLVERAAVINYLLRYPDAIAAWESGWQYRERPSLGHMLEEFSPSSKPQQAREVCDMLNHLVHGDPIGAELNAIHLSDGVVGYVVGRQIDAASFCDFLCSQAVSWLVVLRAAMHDCFPGLTEVWSEVGGD